MKSLKTICISGSLPDSASGLWRMDREYGVSNTRVKHIVIHEAHIRESPDRHVVGLLAGIFEVIENSG